MITAEKFQLLKRIWFIEFSTATLATLLCWWVNTITAYSILLGALIQIVPSAYLAMQTYRERGAQKAPSILNNIYRGELGKFALTVVGFACVFASGIAINTLALFIAYIGAVVLHTVLVAKATSLNHY